MSDYLINSLEQQWKKDPGSRVFLRLAEELRKAERFSEAADVCRQGIQHHPGYLPALICLGRSLQASQEFGEAKSVMENVLGRQPDNPHALRVLTDVAIQEGSFSKAGAYLDTLNLVDPGDDFIEERRVMIAAQEKAQQPVDAVEGEAAVETLDDNGGGHDLSGWDEIDAEEAFSSVSPESFDSETVSVPYEAPVDADKTVSVPVEFDEPLLQENAPNPPLSDSAPGLEDTDRTVSVPMEELMVDPERTVSETIPELVDEDRTTAFDAEAFVAMEQQPADRPELMETESTLPDADFEDFGGEEIVNEKGRESGLDDQFEAALADEGPSDIEDFEAELKALELESRPAQESTVPLFDYEKKVLETLTGEIASADELAMAGLAHEKREHYELALSLYRHVRKDQQGHKKAGEGIERIRFILANESDGRRKIRALNGWLDKIKGAYHV